MSLENEIKKNTAAIVALTEALLKGASITPEEVTPAPPAPPKVEDAPPTPPKQEEAPAPPTPPAPPAPPEQAGPAMTAEELNAAVVIEFQRLGTREPIDKVLTEMGATGISTLPAERYAEFLDKVKVL